MEDNTTTRSTPKDVFLHLLNILTFYISVTGFITLYIQYISALFPDPLNFYYTGIADAVRLSTSLLVIAVSVYLLTSWLLGKDLKKNHGKRELRLREGLLYFILFISAVTIIVDLIMFVYNFLSGELTIQFFLKLLVVLLVAAAVFGYYIWDLRRKDTETSKTPKILAWLLCFVVLTSVILGFFIIGTPSEQRDRRFDERRINDLQMLQSQIINYWVQKETLPQELSVLEDSISGFMVPQDPQTEADYEYHILSPLSFELCATFKTSTEDFTFSYRGSEFFYKAPVPYGVYQPSWEHEAGRTCFERTIDPELYKNNEQLKTLLPVRD